MGSITFNHRWLLVDLDSGDRTLVVDGGVGPGYFGSAHTIVPDGLFYVSDHVLGAVLVTDPTSGERVILSR